MTKPVTFDRWVIRRFADRRSAFSNGVIDPAGRLADAWLQANAGVFTWRATNVDNGIVYLTGILRG